MAKSEANSKPVLAAEDIFIVTVYVQVIYFIYLRPL
jgi:hypothetical protein